jgi:hypothetical protein
MSRPAIAAKAEQSQDISLFLKDLDKEIATTCPDAIGVQSAGKLYEDQSKRIANALESAASGSIKSLAHAVFHDFSNSPTHREEAKRWFEANSRERKKLRYVFDRFDGLARLSRLKEAQGQGDSTLSLTAFPELPEEDNSAVSLYLDPEGVRFLFSLPDIHGTYPPEIAALIQRKLQNRPYIFLAFPPKCGGTYLRDILGRISGAGSVPKRPGHALGGRDVSPYLPTLAAQMLSVTGPKAFMTHAHMIAHHANIELLNLFKIKPVVMKRSIPDMLRSFSDMTKTEGRDKDGGYNWSLLCGVHTNESFLAMDAAERADFLVYHQAPWYIQFYASWFRAHRNNRLPVHWVAFDEFRTDPAGTARGILEFYGLKERGKYIPAAIARAQANKDTLRFNKGVSGRGAEFLKPHHMDHLHRLAAGYPDIDFVAEGLLPALVHERGEELPRMMLNAKSLRTPPPQVVHS